MPKVCRKYDIGSTFSSTSVAGLAAVSWFNFGSGTWEALIVTLCRQAQHSVYLILVVVLVYNIINMNCTTIHRYPIFSMRYSVMCEVYTGYYGTSEIEYDLYACMVDLSITGAQTMLCLSLIIEVNGSIKCLSEIYVYH